MTLILKQLFGLIRLLNSETETPQIVAGVTCGFILGMTPTLSLQSLLIFICLFFFRIQLGTALISAFFFSFIAYILDPLFHTIGENILNANVFKDIFIILYNMPIIPYTRFNNTIVMGSGVVSITLSPLIFFISKKLIENIVLRFLKDLNKQNFGNL